MLLRDFRIGWRVLAKDRSYSAVVILGLATGIAACFLLLGLVRHAFSYDRHVPEHAQVYRLMERWNLALLGTRWSPLASQPARDAALASGQPVLATTFIGGELATRIDGQVRTFGVTLVDADFARVFSPTVLAGDLRAALTRPDGIALTRATATKLFGSADAAQVVGKTLQADAHTMTVLAVLADQPAATTTPYDSLTGSETDLMPREAREHYRTAWGFTGGSVYLKLLPGADPDVVLDSIRRGLRQSSLVRRDYAEQVATLGGRDLIDYRLGPLADAYLDPDQDGALVVHGNRQLMLGLGAVAGLILLLAATNYVNLATVRTLGRQREIAVRKVLGASAPHVARQFLAESVLVCLAATLLGLLLAWLLLPVFADLVQRRFDAMFNAGAVAATLALGLLLGLAAGAYPAWSALRVRASAALAGRSGSETARGLWLRRALTVVQLASAMGLVATTLAVAWQTRHASTLDAGFDMAPLLMFAAPNDARKLALRDDIARLPGVAGVALSHAPFSVGHNIVSLRREGGDAADLGLYAVSPAFFGVLDVKPVAGRVYDPALDQPHQPDRVVVNAGAARRLGFASPHDAIGKILVSPGSEASPMQVVGVVPDLRHRSARDALQPTVYYLREQVGMFTVRVDGDLDAAARAIEALWPRHYPNEPLTVSRVRKVASDLFYADDLRLAQLLGAASVIASAIAAFGIYVLAAYSVQRRAKEIVLRKLYGAGSGAIGGLMAREFATLLGAGAVLGLPLAYLAIRHYLGAFTEQAPIGGWTLATGLLLVCVVTLGAAWRHALAAMRMRPVLALRD